jgi:hypothetical protein
MTDMSNASYLILADKADDPGAMSAAICVLVARLEAAEKARAGLLTVQSNDMNDIVLLGLAKEELQSRLARSEAALAEAEAANVGLREALEQMVDEKVDYMQINKLGNPEAQHTIKAARKALATPAPSRVADLVKAARECRDEAARCYYIMGSEIENAASQSYGYPKIHALCKAALAPFPEPEPEVKDE